MLYGYFYLVAMFKHRWRMYVKLEFDDAIVKDWFAFNIQDINHLRYFI